MFEDEGSLRRRPRGFRRKQQIKAYSNSGSFYPPSSYDGPAINVGEIQNCYPTPYSYETYSNIPSGPPPPPTFADPWQYQSDYVRNPSPPQHVSSPQNGVLEYGGSYQNYQPYETNGGELNEIAAHPNALLLNFQHFPLQLICKINLVEKILHRLESLYESVRGIVIQQVCSMLCLGENMSLRNFVPFHVSIFLRAT